MIRINIPSLILLALCTVQPLHDVYFYIQFRAIFLERLNCGRPSIRVVQQSARAQTHIAEYILLIIRR